MSTTIVKNEMDGWVSRNQSRIQKEGWGESAMNIVQHSILLQMLARGIVAAGYVLVIGLFAVLAFAWVLCGKLYQLGEEGRKRRSAR